MKGKDDSTSVLGSALRLRGRVAGRGSLAIEGEVLGDVSVDGAIWVASSASVEGTVEAESLDVAGRVSGDISIRGLAQIRNGGSLSGTLRCARIAVEPGADVQADLEMGEVR